jgi:hypothetical protein
MNMAEQSKRNRLELGTGLAECKQEQHVYLRSCALKSRIGTEQLYDCSFVVARISSP